MNTEMSEYQLGHYFSQLINEQKIFPHICDTFCCALVYRMVLALA